MENEKKLSFNQEMNENEISKSILLLKEALKRGLFTYEHADPIKESCYISSGFISGVYFPNTEIKINKEIYYTSHTNYNFCCIAKVDYRLCFVFSLKDEINPIFKNISLKQFITDEIESVLYSYDERQIKSQLEKKLNDHENELKQLEKIERQRTKSGEDFKLINKCFNNCNIVLNYSIFEHLITSFKVNYLTTIYLRDPIKEINADLIEQKIEERKTTLKNLISNDKTALKDLFKNYNKMLKIKNECKKFFESLEHGEKYTFKEQFKTMF